MRYAQIVRGNITGVGFISRDKEIQPTVVVVVPKPHGKAKDGLADPCVLGDIGEVPLSVGAGAVVVEE